MSVVCFTVLANFALLIVCTGWLWVDVMKLSWFPPTEGSAEEVYVHIWLLLQYIGCNRTEEKVFTFETMVLGNTYWKFWIIFKWSAYNRWKHPTSNVNYPGPKLRALRNSSWGYIVDFIYLRPILNAFCMTATNAHKLFKYVTKNVYFNPIIHV